MPVTKWTPERDPRVLRRIGKTGEECAELSKICSRITIQGMDGVDPGTGFKNFHALIQEVADVLAQCEVTIRAFAMPRHIIEARVQDKMRQMAEWEAMFS